MIQLEIYAALFCLEYGYSPDKISMELRIYQSGECRKMVPESEEIRNIMDKIVEFDMILSKLDAH